MEFDLTRFLMYLAYLALIVFVPWLLTVLKNKTNNEKLKQLLNVAEDFASNCVDTIEQTYVIPAKNAGTWDEETAQEAFEQCKNLILAGLGDSAKRAIDVLFGDVDIWVQTIIESNVLSSRRWG